MNQTKKILNIAIAISIVLCSISLFIYSLKFSPLNAQNSAPPPQSYKVVGLNFAGLDRGYGRVVIYGYDPTKPVGQQIRILANEIPR
jgi:hypothetical protein